MRRIPVIVIAAGIAAAVAGCGSGGGSGSAAPSSAPAPAQLSGSVTVFAAASLQEAFGTIGRQFQAAHPGVRVTFSFGASSTLAQQIISGAPADVFASASPKNMQQIVSAGDASSPATFASNVMEVAVPADNPGHVSSVADLAKPPVKVALCQPQVPCGVVAAEVFRNARLTVRPVTLQPDVKSVLTQVELGDVDAGMVYVTDVRAAGTKVKGVVIPANENASTAYPIATVSKSGNLAAAKAFEAYVLSPAGQSALTAAGFQKP